MKLNAAVRNPRVFESVSKSRLIVVITQMAAVIINVAATFFPGRPHYSESFLLSAVNLPELLQIKTIIKKG